MFGKSDVEDFSFGFGVEEEITAPLPPKRNRDRENVEPIKELIMLNEKQKKISNSLPYLDANSEQRKLRKKGKELLGLKQEDDEEQVLDLENTLETMISAILKTDNIRQFLMNNKDKIKEMVNEDQIEFLDLLREMVLS